jgi:hypothetical protein
MDDFEQPPTQPYGSLVPPTKVPGTALALATPPPPPRRSTRRTMAHTGFFTQLISRTLDVVDDLADNVAAGLGLRH